MGSFLKEELSNDFSEKFYGLQPAYNKLKFFVNVFSMTNH